MNNKRMNPIIEGLKHVHEAKPVDINALKDELVKAEAELKDAEDRKSHAYGRRLFSLSRSEYKRQLKVVNDLKVKIEANGRQLRTKLSVTKDIVGKGFYQGKFHQKYWTGDFTVDDGGEGGSKLYISLIHGRTSGADKDYRVIKALQDLYGNDFENKDGTLIVSKIVGSKEQKKQDYDTSQLKGLWKKRGDST